MAKAKGTAKAEAKKEAKTEAKEAPQTEAKDETMLDVKVESAEEVSNEPKDEKLEQLAINLQSQIRSFCQLVRLLAHFQEILQLQNFHLEPHS
ncbi:unnamed protein product [Toxocara canis]|uniref:Uncharacterized protein n=1 Tax=Toxocara canis TaxID=6265 RepID=A0A183U8Y4_TOXCA|nr:unnamed protein product [Toxocara canis]